MQKYYQCAIIKDGDNIVAHMLSTVNLLFKRDCVEKWFYVENADFIRMVRDGLVHYYKWESSPVFEISDTDKIKLRKLMTEEDLKHYTDEYLTLIPNYSKQDFDLLFNKDIELCHISGLYLDAKVPKGIIHAFRPSLGVCDVTITSCSFRPALTDLNSFWIFSNLDKMYFSINSLLHFVDSSLDYFYNCYLEKSDLLKVFFSVNKHNDKIRRYL